VLFSLLVPSFSSVLHFDVSLPVNEYGNNYKELRKPDFHQRHKGKAQQSEKTL